MAITLYIRTDANAPSPPLVSAATAGAVPVAAPTLASRNIVDVYLYLVDGAGGYDARSGDATYTPRIAVGTPGASPAGGTFTVTCGANTTSALAYYVSASALQTALNALASVTTAGGLTVAGTWPEYILTWTATGDVPDLTADGSALTPLSNAITEVKTAGDTGVNEVVWLTLAQQALTEQSTFTAIANGWQGQFSTWTAKASELLTGEVAIQQTLEVALRDPDGNLGTLLQCPIDVLGSVVATDGTSSWAVPHVTYAETDPVFSASPSATITQEMIDRWEDASGWGDHTTPGYATLTYVQNTAVQRQAGRNDQRYLARTTPYPQLYWQTDDVEFPRGPQVYQDGQWMPINSVYNADDGHWYYKRTVSVDGEPTEQLVQV